MMCCKHGKVTIPIYKISLDTCTYITNGRVTPNMIFGLFLDNLNISEQTIDSALTTYTELYNYNSKRKIMSFDPHHPQKPSIGFKSVQGALLYSYHVARSDWLYANEFVLGVHNCGGKKKFASGLSIGPDWWSSCHGHLSNNWSVGRGLVSPFDWTHWQRDVAD